jgi:hypothetical protein
LLAGAKRSPFRRCVGQETFLEVKEHNVGESATPLNMDLIAESAHELHDA